MVGEIGLAEGQDGRGAPVERVFGPRREWVRCPLSQKFSPQPPLSGLRRGKKIPPLGQNVVMEFMISTA